jgi:hypothetical protein
MLLSCRQHWSTYFHIAVSTEAHAFILLSTQKHMLLVCRQHRSTCFYFAINTEAHAFILLSAQEAHSFILQSAQKHILLFCRQHRSTCFYLAVSTEAHFILPSAHKHMLLFCCQLRSTCFYFTLSTENMFLFCFRASTQKIMCLFGLCNYRVANHLFHNFIFFILCTFGEVSIQKQVCFYCAHCIMWGQSREAFLFLFIFGVKTVTWDINLTVSPERVVRRNLGQVRLALRSACCSSEFFSFIPRHTFGAFFYCMAKQKSSMSPIVAKKVNGWIFYRWEQPWMKSWPGWISSIRALWTLTKLWLN